MQSNEVVAQAITILAALASKGAEVAQGGAAHVLGEIVAERFRKTGHAAAWDNFTQSPKNDSLVRHILKQALQDDADFRSRLDQAVQAAVTEKSQNSGRQSIDTGTGDAQIGDRNDMITGSRIATRGSNYHEGDVNNASKHVTSEKGSSGVQAVLVVVALLVIGLATLLIKAVPVLLNQMQNGGLTANSTCRQFLNTDEQSEDQVMVDTAESKGIGGFGSPLALPEIRYECSSEPTMTIGDLIERDKGEF